jgi:hypothetical protein
MYALYFIVFGVGFGGLIFIIRGKSKPVFGSLGARILGICASFCLGAGIAGLIGVITNHTGNEGYLWLLGGGVVSGLGASAKLLRRKSQTSPPPFRAEKAIINAPMPPGFQGTALVRRFGKDVKIPIRCKNKKLGFIKGAEVRIVEYEGAVYWIEPL